MKRIPCYTGDPLFDKIIFEKKIPEELWAVKWIEMNWGSLDNALATCPDFGGEAIEIAPACLWDEIELFFEKCTEVKQ